jgi:hypothetical protein
VNPHEAYTGAERYEFARNRAESHAQQLSDGIAKGVAAAMAQQALAKKKSSAAAASAAPLPLCINCQKTNEHPPWLCEDFCHLTLCKADTSKRLHRGVECSYYKQLQANSAKSPSKKQSSAATLNHIVAMAIAEGDAAGSDDSDNDSYGGYTY